MPHRKDCQDPTPRPSGATEKPHWPTSQDEENGADGSQQYLPHHPNPDFPHWGRDQLDHGHAVFAVVAHLRSLKLEGWAPRIVHWLSFYDGIERWVDLGQEPSVCVRDVLACHVMRSGAGVPPSKTALKQAITEDLLQLEFLCYRAWWGPGMLADGHARVWRPLAQPWLEFIDSERPGDELMVFQTENNMDPPLAIHRQFLLHGE